MNLCFFGGVIESEPDFKFIVSNNLNFKDSLHISISRFKLAIDKSTKIIVKAYDELADYCYQNLKRGNYIFISGRLNDLNEVEIELIQRL